MGGRPLIRWVHSGKDRLPAGLEAEVTDGGNSFNHLAVSYLKRSAQVEVDYPSFDIAGKPLARRARLDRMRRLEGSADLWVLDFLSLALCDPAKLRGRKAALIHHVDHRFSKRRRWYALLERRFKANLSKIDVGLTGAQHWKSKLEAWGAPEVRIIHNFIPEAPALSPLERAKTRETHGLSEAPLILIGRAALEKGADVAAEALHGRGYELITTGRPDLSLPCRNFALPYSEYLRLVASCDVGVFMSRMEEGWCRQLHEALSFGVPSTGTGAGGMRELLEGSRLPIAASGADLPGTVQELLETPPPRQSLVDFARTFTRERFEKDIREALGSQGLTIA